MRGAPTRSGLWPSLLNPLSAGPCWRGDQDPDLPVGARQHRAFDRPIVVAAADFGSLAVLDGEYGDAPTVLQSVESRPISAVMRGSS